MNEIYLRQIKNWPAHWQAAFEELRISMGVRNAYYAVKNLRGGIVNA